MSTKIEWADKVWNPVTGCTKISPGCENCYAERMSKRLKGRFGYPSDDPFRVTLHRDKLEQPIHWKKPQQIFVCSMGDLFHEDVQFSWARAVFRIMLQASHHTYMVLTKRPEKMKRFFADLMHHDDFGSMGNLDHVWLGVTAENQGMADKRIPILLQIPAAVRFVSVEPMLRRVVLDPFMEGSCLHCYGQGEIGPNEDCPNCSGTGEGSKLDLVICGGESGPGARPMHPDWARSLRDQCVEAGIPYFFKGRGEWKEIPKSSKRPERIPKKNIIKFSLSGNDIIPDPLIYPYETVMHKVGKKASGRLLDGRTWNQFPEKIS